MAVALRNIPTDPEDPRIEVRRSSRRRRTVSARVEGDKVIVLMPSGLPKAEEHRLIGDMLARLAKSRRRAGSALGDEELERRAGLLSSKWLDGKARPTSVRWVGNMSRRWGSCTAETGEIRISESLRDVPAYVLDYVLVHELAHLIVPGGHSSQFWDQVSVYPRTERAIGYLEAYARLGAGGAAGEPPLAEDAACEG